mgnify:CR=1 FL=1
MVDETKSPAIQLEPENLDQTELMELPEGYNEDTLIMDPSQAEMTLQTEED